MKRIPEKKYSGCCCQISAAAFRVKILLSPLPSLVIGRSAAPLLILRCSVSSPIALYAFVINGLPLFVLQPSSRNGVPAAGEGRLARRCKVRPGHPRMPMHLNEVCLSCWPQRGGGITAHFAVLRCPISFGSLALTSLNLPVARC